MILLSSGRATPAPTVTNLDRRWPVAEAEGKVWIGTPEGLLRYAPVDDAFKLFEPAGGGAASGVREISYHDEWMWCLLDSGLAALHIRLGDWLRFDRLTGLPSSAVNGVAFDGDYVWAATDSGAARFDVLIEEWETFGPARGLPETKVNDVITTAGRTWFVTDHTLTEYDAQFEKWRYHDMAGSSPVVLQRAFSFADDIWLVCDRGLVRFDPTLETRQDFFQAYLAEGDLIDLALKGDAIWAVTRMGLFSFSKTSGVWNEFEANSNLQAHAIANACLDGENIWVTTGQGVLFWKGADKRWVTLDYSSGLSRSDFEAVYSSGDMTFLLGGRSFSYRRNAAERWRAYDLAGAGETQAAGRHLLLDLIDNEKGGRAQAGPYSLGFEGTRVTLVDAYKGWLPDQGLDRWDETHTQRLDLKSQLGLGNRRSISGFHNNIDYGKTMYGLHYRADNDDVLQDAAWGDLRHAPGGVPFGEPVSLFGYSAWFQGGAKTARLKRSLVTARVDLGERRSAKTYEHFAGLSRRDSTVIRDINYAWGFYRMPGLLAGEKPEWLEIYADDLFPGSNTSNTLEGRTIAGITGDFDLWVPTEAYGYYPGLAAIRLRREASPDWTLVARYSAGGTTREEVLQAKDGSSAVAENLYYLQSPRIIPYSFRVIIEDSLGATVPLSVFGIDSDQDGLVDSDWIDYENGLLTFPAARPFPPEVYDPDSPRSIYRMESRYETSSPTYGLGHGDLVRGTEVVRLDGLEAKPGEDYILDYTFGALVFVREGLVNPDTRIEVEYEYYAATDTEDVGNASVNFSPSDNLYIQADWLARRREAAQAGDESATSNLVGLHSELVKRLGSYDVKLIPGLTYSGERSAVAATSLETLISSTRLRFRATHQTFNANYTGLFHPQSVVGEIGENLEISSTADLTRSLRLSGQWRRVEALETKSSASGSDRAGNLAILFKRAQWPSWEVSLSDFAASSGSHTTKRRFIQSRWEYQMAEAVARRLALRALRLEAFLRGGDDESSAREAAPKQASRQGYVRLNTTVADRIQSGLFYRTTNTYAKADGASARAISRSQRAVLSLTHEQWRLIQFSAYAENTQDALSHTADSFKDVRLNQYSQLNVRLAPGVLVAELGALNFELNANVTRSAVGTTQDESAGWVWRLFGPRVQALGDWQTSATYLVRNEFRPSAAWNLNSTLEWNDHAVDFVRGDLESGYWRWTENLDVSLAPASRLKAQYRLYREDRGYRRATQTHAPAISLEHRWTPDFQNIAYLDYTHKRDDETNVHGTSQRWHTRYDLIWTRDGLVRIRRLELRQTIAGSHSWSQGYLETDRYELNSGTSLDLFPLRSTIVRLQAEWTRYWDLESDSGEQAVSLTVRTSFKF